MIRSEIQSLSPSAVIELFVLDASNLAGGSVYRFHAGTNGLTQPVVWQGQTYQPLPIEASGFDVSTKGSMPRPKLKVANVNGLLSASVKSLSDFVGCKVTRKRTFAKYLDAANFPARRNLLVRTEDFRSAAEGGGSWGQFDDTGDAISAVPGYADPFGGTAANKITANTLTTMQRQVSQSVAAIGNNAAFTNSVFAKAGEAQFMRLYASTRTSPVYYPATLFDLRTGRVLSAQTSGGYATVPSVTAIGDGWYRYSVTLSSAGTGTTSAAIIIQMTSPTGSNFTPSKAGDGFFLFGAQTELGSTLTNYQPVGATWSQNPTADSTQFIPDDVWFVERKMSENRYLIEFELSSAFDLMGQMLPNRQVLQNSCPWKYRGTECGYSGASYYDINNNATTVANDRCAKTLAACKLRFGTQPIRFGGFPGAIRGSD